jgi:hypothetical protein
MQKGDRVSDQNQNDLRPLRLEEDSLVRALLRHVTGGERLLRQLKRAQVCDMDDGGMGSFAFAGGEYRSLGSCLEKPSIWIAMASQSVSRSTRTQMDCSTNSTCGRSTSLRSRNTQILNV